MVNRYLKLISLFPPQPHSTRLPLRPTTSCAHHPHRLLLIQILFITHGFPSLTPWLYRVILLDKAEHRLIFELIKLRPKVVDFLLYLLGYFVCLILSFLGDLAVYFGFHQL
jgi:hypothetical protein